MKLWSKVKKRIKLAVRRISDAHLSNAIILVYSMGKVGSSTIFHSLRKRLPHIDIFHVHFLSEYWLDERLPSAHALFRENINLGKEILNHIQKHPSRRLKVITLVREPIDRDISGIFQNWTAHFDANEQVGMDTLKEKMNQHKHDYTLDWFNSEFRNFLNFDIYSVPFDRLRGYSIYRLEKADVLCIRLESLNEVYKSAFKEFLGLDDFVLRDKNKSEDKENNRLYAEFKETLQLDTNKLYAVYSSRYVTHFYTEPEIQKFLEKWT